MPVPPEEVKASDDEVIPAVVVKPGAKFPANTRFTYPSPVFPPSTAETKAPE